jgi:hypothetical protein
MAQWPEFRDGCCPVLRLLSCFGLRVTPAQEAQAGARLA